jgi:hypothetical protein
MEPGIYTLQDFMYVTKSVIYVLMIVALVAFVAFWRFLSEDPRGKGPEPPAGRAHH